MRWLRARLRVQVQALARLQVLALHEKLPQLQAHLHQQLLRLCSLHEKPPQQLLHVLFSPLPNGAYAQQNFLA